MGLRAVLCGWRWMRRLVPTSRRPYTSQGCSLPPAPDSSDPEAEAEAPGEGEGAAAGAAARPARRLVVGLGNHPPEFGRTRHNVGFRALDAFAGTQLPAMASDPTSPLPSFEYCKAVKGTMAKWDVAFPARADAIGDDLVDGVSARRKARTAEEGVPFPEVQLVLLQPHTLMNRSGGAVKRCLEQLQWRPRPTAPQPSPRPELLVVYDDVALPFGRCRITADGSSAGQNGVQDVITQLHTERFARLRIGVAPSLPHQCPTVHDKARWVLQKFDAQEEQHLPVILHLVGEVLRVYLHRGLDAAANVANGLDLLGEEAVERYQRAKPPSKKRRRT